MNLAPLNYVLAQNVFFLRNRSSYSFETCTIVIITPENLRVHWVWPSNYKGKWCFSPKVFFSEVDHHTALKLVPLTAENLRVHWVWPSKYTEFSPKCVVFRNRSYSLETCTIAKWPENLCTFLNTEKWHFSPKCVFFQKSYSFETCTIVIITPENLRVHWVWSSKYKEKWYVNPKCVFLRNGSSYSFETCTIVIIRPENLRVH